MTDIILTEPTRHEKQVTCECCLLTTMRDCPRCKFLVEYTPTTSKDVYDMFIRLWGDARSPEHVAYYSQLTDGEQYDQTQLTDCEIAEIS